MFKIKKDLTQTEPIKRGRGRPLKIQPETLEQNRGTIKDWTGRNRSRLAIVLAIIILAVVPSLYFYNKNQTTEKLLKTPSAAAKEETARTIQKVGKHIILPAGEEPTLATVSDTDKLKGQTFFDRAQNGDKLLVYSKARKVILYRPSVDKIVDTTLLNVTNSSTKTSP